MTVVVVLLPLLVALAFGRTLAARGARPTARQRVALGLGVFAVLFPALGLAALSKTVAPISPSEWWQAIGLLAAIGATPLGAWLVLDAALRLTRRWEARRGVGGGAA
jgi:hypothetical protein